MTPATAAALARRALANIRREYPNHPQYLLERAADAVAPRVAHPCFYGCFDWHSAVHTHWLLVRLLNTVPELVPRERVRAALAESFAPASVRVEARYLAKHRSFERPYGFAWALLLGAEVNACNEPAARAWRRSLRPFLDVVRGNVLAWLAALRYAVRSGTHNQTAFALGLLHDAATALHDGELVSAIRRKALVLYRADENAPLHFEPSGEDFLSPALAEADLMRRVLSRASFARWLGGFLPGIPARDVGWLSPGRVDDETDGKLVHLHGLTCRGRGVSRASRPRSTRRTRASRCCAPPRAAIGAQASPLRSPPAITRATIGCRRSRCIC